jgi:hypothetical protein
MPDDIMKMQVEGHPYNEAYQWLSATHKADYLRCYFLHFYGGGYADIKCYSKDNNWKDCFDLINQNQDVWAIGQKERMGGSPIKEYNNTESLKHLIANCYFIMRPQTEFTQRWFDKVNELLDKNIDALKNCWDETKNNPQIHCYVNKKYPFRWAEILGEIIHPLEMEYKDTGHILNILNTGRTSVPYR